MKIIATKHNSKKSVSTSKKCTKVNSATGLEYDFDDQYLMSLADAIEDVLLTDFDVEASAYYDGSNIVITSDIDDDDAFEAIITQADFVGLSGDLETDAYPFAEEYYTSL
ncbi:MAG: hypothetical protein NC548_47385 [Lachnospiraceae bacterium]|nr:hypothetical protein [Lachnospiraceae bacterium]